MVAGFARVLRSRGRSIRLATDSYDDTGPSARRAGKRRARRLSRTGAAPRRDRPDAAIFSAKKVDGVRATKWRKAGVKPSRSALPSMSSRSRSDRLYRQFRCVPRRHRVRSLVMISARPSAYRPSPRTPPQPSCNCKRYRIPFDRSQHARSDPGATHFQSLPQRPTARQIRIDWAQQGTLMQGRRDSRGPPVAEEKWSSWAGQPARSIVGIGMVTSCAKRPGEVKPK